MTPEGAATGDARRSTAAPAGTVEEVICERVTERAGEWFPEVGPRPAVRLHLLRERPRAVLYRVDVVDGPAHRRMLAKVRRAWPEAVGGPGARPRLAPSLLSAAEQTALEFSGLTAISSMVGSRHPAFAAVRPLDHLVAEDTVLMEYVQAPTLRDVLAADHRLAAPLRHGSRRAPSRTAEHAWERCGAWLRTFQQEMPGDDLPARQATSEEVADRFTAFGAYLTTRLGARSAGDAVRTGARLAAEVLPPRLPLAVGHGDFAPRNVFALDDGRVAVFDPLPRWRVPRFEDLCRFLVAVRLQAAQVYTQGAAYAAANLDRRERAVLAGYRGDEELPMAELHCQQLLITMDRWCTLVGGGGRVRRASALLASAHLRREARRLVRLIGSDGS